MYSAAPWAGLALRPGNVSAALQAVAYPSALGTGGQGAFLHFSDGSGALLSASNGFLSVGANSSGAPDAPVSLSVAYHPVLTWNVSLQAQDGVPGCDARKAA